MRIILNGDLTEVSEETTEGLRRSRFPDCDTVILDGVPVTEDTGLGEYARVYIGRFPEGIAAAMTERSGIPCLGSSAVGIAGAGGLGSNIATYLARSGVGRIVIADFDRVEMSNLNRQNYSLEHLGLFKVDAVSEVIAGINPDTDVETHAVRLDRDNISAVFRGCDAICEAFDAPSDKAMLLECVSRELPGTPLVCGNGMSGIRDTASMTVRNLTTDIFICGDGLSEESEGILAPRVAVCAGIMANKVLQILVSRKTENDG